MVQSTQFIPEDIGNLDVYTPLRAKRGNYTYNFAPWGSLGYTGGKPATMKTTILESLMAAGLSGKEILGFEFDLGDKVIIRADGEQDKSQFERGCMNVLKLAGKTRDTRFIAHSYIGTIDPQQRLNDLWTTMYQYRRNLGLIVVDGIANFMMNANNADETKLLTSRFNKIANDYQCIVVFVNHLTDKQDKSTKLFGTIGSEIDKIATWGFITVQQGQFFGLTKGKFRVGKAVPNLWMTNNDGVLIKEPYFPF